MAHTSKKRKTTESTAKQPFISLQAYISNAFYGLLIQDDDEIFEISLDNNWSRKVKENDNGTPLNFKSFHDFVIKTRASITDRQLISQSFVVSPSDKEGITGQVAHTSQFSGVQDGKAVQGTVVAILKIGLEEGRRIIETESFVLAFD